MQTFQRPLRHINSWNPPASVRQIVKWTPMPIPRLSLEDLAFQFSIPMAESVRHGNKSKADMTRQLHTYLYKDTHPSQSDDRFVEAQRVGTILDILERHNLESPLTVAIGGMEGQGHIRQALGWTIVRISESANKTLAQGIVAAKQPSSVEEVLDCIGIFIDNDKNKAYGYLMGLRYGWEV
jgi:hypothetical protein